MYRNLLLLVTLLVISAVSLSAQSYTGMYLIQAPDGIVVMVLQQDAEGNIDGTLTSGGYEFRVEGGLDAPGISGLVTGSDGAMGFDAVLQGNQLQFKLFNLDAVGQPNYTTAQTIVFARNEGAPNTTYPNTNQPATGGDREVYINGQYLAEAQVLQMEKRYNTKVPSGRFWYDAQCGAWGMEGGPTLGFIMAGLDLPGPMPADISGGGTSIFINGREIHPQDQQALYQMLGVTYPGRFWLDSQGNLGTEGGGVLVNLVQVTQRASGGSSGGLYSGMGGTVGVDGSGGVLFYSRTSSGGYQSWSN